MTPTTSTPLLPHAYWENLATKFQQGIPQLTAFLANLEAEATQYPTEDNDHRILRTETRQLLLELHDLITFINQQLK